MIRITNSLSGKKENFVPREPGSVKLYVCGITPYDYAHVGHGRCYVTFDLLYRLLKFLGYTVSYARNFTDIDDKIIARAHKEFGDASLYKKITDKYIAAYHEDMKNLGCESPDFEPRVTQMIPDIITFIQGLIDKGHAYVVGGDVYFAISSFDNYAQLSKHNLDDLRAGARVLVNDQKKDPLDFALWKSEPEGAYWQSPWGWGRPGWHIECSVMASKYLGPHIDIHAGGQDLIFPHHDNEIAQSEALHGTPFSKYWMHNGFVQINKEKMSKSLGNFFTLKEVFEQFDPMVVRFYILSHHYRAPLDFSFDDLKAVEKSYKRLVRVFSASECDPQPTHRDIMDSPLINKMLTFLMDDLNSPGMWGVVFENLDTIKENPQELCAVKVFLQQVLGLSLAPISEKSVEITPEIQALIDARAQARADKNWALADELRDKLRQLGVDVQDTKL